ncbi:hypothetical protein [Streptomyces sp. NPDC005805]|uniref:hypothetical protein n=1 Tax=Streptomyces sp. NPDC005805 TaxID=3157068 RepID=UPI0034036188
MSTEDTRDAVWFDRLATALRAQGVPDERAGATRAELATHLAETGTRAEEEFGPAAEFAARLGGAAPGPGAPGEGVDEPGEGAEEWTWTADVYRDLELLAAHGDAGWEVQRLDRLGRFVCRREPGTAMRWEYRREIVGAAGAQAPDGALARLAPEGWELCGEWFHYAYFKRPRSADEGPAAMLTALPARPGRSWYIGAKALALPVGWLLVVAVVQAGYWTGRLGIGWTVGLLTGGALLVALATRRIVASTASPALPQRPPFPRGGEGQTGTGG